MIPIISGTVAGQSVAEGDFITPFANASVTDPNGWTSDTITISLLGANGNASDANGTLVLGDGTRSDTTFAETSPGVYKLTDITPHQATTYVTGLNALLDELKFIPSPNSEGTTTTLSLNVTDEYNETKTDNTTTVSVTGSGGTNTASNPTPTSPTLTSGGTLTDAAGNNWTLTSAGAVEENGTAVPGGRGTSAFDIVGNVLYGQDASSKSWFTYSPTNQYWTSSAAPTLNSAVLYSSLAHS